MPVIHISEAEAVRDFAAVMTHIRECDEVVIDRDAAAVAVLRPANPNVRRLSESLRLAKDHASKVTLDDGFGHDLEEVIRNYSEPVHSEWD